MKRKKSLAGYSLALAVSLAPVAWGQDPIVFMPAPLSSGPIGDPLPTIASAGTWDIPKYNGVLPLTLVTIELTTKVTYSGAITSELLSGVPFELQVLSDFKVDFTPPALPGSVISLDPAVILSLLTGGMATGPANVLFATNGMQMSMQTTSLTSLADLAAYTGVGFVPVAASGLLITNSPAGFHNNSDVAGVPTPATFVNNVKVTPLDQAQLYRLDATLKVTYYVPEAEAPIAAVLGLGIGVYWLRRRQKTVC